MRIGVIAHNLRVAGGLSVGQNVVAAMRRLGGGHEFLLILPGGRGYEEILAGWQNASVLFVPEGGRLPSRGIQGQAARGVLGRAASGLQRVRSGLGRATFDLLRLERVIRDFAPDVVLGLGNMALSRPPCPQAILLQNAKLVCPLEDLGSIGPRNKLNVLLRRRLLVRQAARSGLLFVQTRSMAQLAAGRLGFGGPVRLFPNAVSLGVMDGRDGDDAAALPEQLKATDGKFRLLCLSSYYPHKNIESLVATFERHRDQLRDVAVILTISGREMPASARLLRDIERKGLGQSLVNVGPVEQPRLGACYRACDGVILPTLLESFSGTYLEAMHFRRPILTSDRPFAHEICGAGADYFEPRDPASIAAAIVRLRDNRMLGESLVGQHARQLAAVTTSWDDNVRSMLGELEVLGGMRQVRAPAAAA